MKQLLLLITSVFLSAEIASALVHDVQNSSQFFTNNAPLIVVLLDVFIIYYFFLRHYNGVNRKVINLTFLFLMVMFTVNLLNERSFYLSKNMNDNYSDDYKLTVSSSISRLPDECFGGYYFSDEMETRGGGLTPYFRPANFIQFSNNYHEMCNLSCASDTGRLIKGQLGSFYLHNEPLIRFIDVQKQKNTFSSVEQSELDFIKQYHLKFLIVIKGQKVSEPILSISNLVTEDGNTGEKYYLISD